MVTRPHPKPKPAATPAAAATPAVQVARSAPVHRHAQHRVRASKPRVVTSRQVPKQAKSVSASTSSPIAEHGHGKAKALGHLRKIASQPTSANEALQGARLNGAGHTKAHGLPSDVPHGPPAVPPGQEKKVDAVEHGASGNRGGGK